MSNLALGIDLGGTNLRLGLVTPTGQLTYFIKEPVDWSHSPKEIVETIAGHANATEQLSQVAGVGLALATNLLPGGIIKKALTNYPTLAGFPLTERLSKALGKPCLAGNDANLSLHGEVHFGAARGCNDVLLLTLGTGIGSGLLINGCVRTGAHSSGVEIGLSLFPDWLAQDFKPIEKLVAPSILDQRLNGQAERIFERVEACNAQAQTLLQEMFDTLGLLITNAHLLLDLELVLLGGGFAAVGEPLREGISAAIRRFCPPAYHFDLRIELGGLPADAAGVIGAASLWFEHRGLLPSLTSAKGNRNAA